MKRVFLILGITVFLASCDNSSTENATPETTATEEVVASEEVVTTVEETVTEEANTDEVSE